MLRSCERLFNPHARASLVRSIAHAATAPFGPPVRFRDNLVMDVACSLVRCLVDFETTARFFLTGEYERDRPRLYADHGATSGVITVVPYWFRLQQCVRRFYDAKRGSRERVEQVNAFARERHPGMVGVEITRCDAEEVRGRLDVTHPLVAGTGYLWAPVVITLADWLCAAGIGARYETAIRAEIAERVQTLRRLDGTIRAEEAKEALGRA